MSYKSILTMTEEAVRQVVKKALEENLRISYSLFGKRQRQERILLEVLEDYFVVCSCLKGAKPSIIFFNEIEEAMAILDDPDWKNIEKKSWKEVIQEAQDWYRKNPETEITLKRLLIQSGIGKGNLNTSVARLMLEHLKIVASTSKNPAKFKDLLEELLVLL